LPDRKSRGKLKEKEVQILGTGRLFEEVKIRMDPAIKTHTDGMTIMD
jgi:hypothetical protein